MDTIDANLHSSLRGHSYRCEQVCGRLQRIQVFANANMQSLLSGKQAKYQWFEFIASALLAMLFIHNVVIAANS